MIIYASFNLKGSITGFSGFFSLWVLEEEEESDGFWRLGRMKSNFFLSLLCELLCCCEIIDIVID